MAKAKNLMELATATTGTAGAGKDDVSYYVLADPKEAERIKRSGKDDKALFRGTSQDAQKYAKDRLRNKEAVLLKRDEKGQFGYAVGEGFEFETIIGGINMSRAKEIQSLVESAAVNEMYALGADHIVNWMKKVAYERFDVDPSAISVVPWPEDGSDFNINTPLSEDQYNELAEKITRTYPLYVVEFASPGVMKFYSGRTIGTKPENVDDLYPRDGSSTAPVAPIPSQQNPSDGHVGREDGWKDLQGRTGYDL